MKYDRAAMLRARNCEETWHAGLRDLDCLSLPTEERRITACMAVSDAGAAGHGEGENLVSACNCCRSS